MDNKNQVNVNNLQLATSRKRVRAFIIDDLAITFIVMIMMSCVCYCDDDEQFRGHAQDGQQISFNTLQPYRSGKNEGLYPSIRIRP